MIGRVALLVTFKKAKPKPQSLSRSHIRDLWCITPMKKNSLKTFSYVAFWILPLLVLYFAFTSINMAALYGDQTRFLSPSEFQNEDISRLKFSRDIQFIGFWTSLILIPINLALYVYLDNKGKSSTL